MVKDMIDGLKLVKDGIDSVRAITEAIRSGREYVARAHPEIQPDLRALVEELGKSMGVVKRASGILTHFRFAISADPGVAAAELRKFNDYYIQSKTELQFLQTHHDDLRTHCERIRHHAGRIGGSATRDGFAKLFALLGLKSPAREAELAGELDQLAYGDFAIAHSVSRMLQLLDDALRDVQGALGSGGAMLPENIPAAVALLGEYGPAFEEIEDRSGALVREIRSVTTELR
ncbi:MAG TPA: hypothetical protein VE913_24825 [Longimicrobium sp.]|nr:hypothetical protein [Longimicrobium sp.]